MTTLGKDLTKMSALRHFVVNRQALLLSTWEDLRHDILQTDMQRTLYFVVLGLSYPEKEPETPQGM